MILFKYKISLIFFIILFILLNCIIIQSKFEKQKQNKRNLQQSQYFIQPVPISQQQLQKPTLIEANHYFSNKQKSINYNITKVNNSLPLIIIPKNQYTSIKTAYISKINLTLNDQHGNYIICQLQDNFELCVLQKFITQPISLTIQCQKLPCQFSWEVVQSSIEKINKNLNKHSVKELYGIQKSHETKHLILKVFCDNPEIKKSYEENNKINGVKNDKNGNFIQFYANKDNYHKIISTYQYNQLISKEGQEIFYYLFNNPPNSFQEYFYFKIQESYRKCAQIQIFNAPNQIQINKQINDFIIGGEKLVYKIKNYQQNIAKQGNLRIDASVYFYPQSDKKFQGQFNIKVIAKVGGIIQTLKKMNFTATNKKYIQFLFSINNLSSTYSDVQIQFQSTKNHVIMNFELASGQYQLVQKGQFSFYSLKKGEKIKYKIEPEAQADSNAKIFIFASQEKKVKLSKKQCSQKLGCQFQLQAIQDIDGSIYLGLSKTQNTQQIVKFNINQSFTKKVRQNTITYLNKNVQKDKNYQVVVNTHNVILYAALQSKCPTPGPNCHEKMGNSHHPFIFESKDSGNLIIAVHALDQSQFTITIITQDGEYPTLKNGIPFIYLMDDSQQQIIFKFNLDEKQDLTFSLTSPLNQLFLYIFNEDKLPKNYLQQEQTFTVDGYFYIQKKNIKSKNFIVVVRKIDPKKAQSVHFTLIASTKATNIKLQNGVTHHEKLVQNERQDFIIQFNPNQKYVISFYLHNFIDKNVQISLQLSKDDIYNQKSKDSQNLFTIDKAIDQIDISNQGKKLCKQKGTASCQLFLRLKNKMKKEIDLQITLLNMNAIIQLHDGIWEYFPEEVVSATASFYFFPKHIKNPINIIFKANNPDLRLLYKLIKMDEQTINPQLWSFPKADKNALQFKNLAVRQVKHFNIDRKSLKQCQPNCLLLMSLLKSQQIKGQFNFLNRDQQFGIMVSNSIIEVPQKTKVQLSIHKGQEKYLKMNMKNVFQHDSLTMFIYTSLGQVDVYGNACSQKNLRMPTAEQFDFNFGMLETQFKSSTIMKKFELNDIGQNENSFICLIAVSGEDSKFSIQFTSEQQIISLLNLDQSKTVTIIKNQPKYFQIQGSVQNQIKITRTKGFPYIETKLCEGKKQTYDQCLDSLKQSSQQNIHQLLEKVKKYSYKPCQKCIIYVKISTQEPSQIDIHLQSKYSQTTLQQKKILTDYIQKDQTNKYQLTGLINQITYININIISGSIKCKVEDFQNINLQKTSSQKQKLLQFIITPNQFKTNNQDSGQTSLALNPLQSLMSSFGLEWIFTTLHITIQSVDAQKGASYTIQYSSGQRQTFLQDGLIFKYNLQGNNPKSISKFYYQNLVSNNNVYLFLSTSKSNQFNKIYVKIYQMENLADQQNKEQIDSKIPQMRKKTLKPTVIYPLPIYKFYSIEVSNPTGVDIELSIGVNHQQIIFLPNNLQYPFPLANKQEISMIVNVQNKGYILLILKKCDESTPEISYTFDYEGFQKGEFQYTTTLNNEAKFQYLIKAKKAGPLYINIKRDQNQAQINSDYQFRQSIFTISARYSVDKIKTTDYLKAGNKGIVNYEIVSGNKIKLQFHQITCESKSPFCSSKFQYFLVASNKMVDVYSQSVCSSTFLADNQNSQSHKILPLRKILQKADFNHKISFEYQLDKSSPISYIAIKAVYRNSQSQSIQVYYQPIQVLTLIGQVQKVSNKHENKIIFISFIVLCLFWFYCKRKQKKKGYQILQANQ